MDFSVPGFRWFPVRRLSAACVVAAWGVAAAGCGDPDAGAAESAGAQAPASQLAAAGQGAADLAHGDAATRALLDDYCVSCHNFEDWAGGRAFDVLDVAQIGAEAETGEAVIRKLRAGMMPPYGEPRPDRAALDAAAAHLEARIDLAAADSPVLTPPGAHRLNRREYENAVRDLIGLEVDAASLLPVDDSSYGFDNMAGSLGSSPALVEAYVSAAAKLSRLAMGRELQPRQTNYLAPVDYSQDQHMEGMPFGTRGGLQVTHTFTADGEYVFNWAPVRTNAGGLFGDTTGEQLELSIDGERIKLYDLETELQRNSAVDRHEVRAFVEAGERTVALTFLSLVDAPTDDLNRHFARTTLTHNVDGFHFSPHINSMTIAGPFDAAAAADTDSRARILICRPERAEDEEACAETILTTLARRAFRRPLEDGDRQALMGVYREARGEGGDFEAGVQRGLQMILADPNFIYRGEEIPATAEPHRLSDLELASRLSFFLWSTIPDEELLSIAEQGRLQAPGVVEAQVERMLADPRSKEFVRNFAGQWLQLRNLASSSPVPLMFPDFDDNLRDAFRTEVELFFESILREDRSVVDLLDADYTFVNGRLAEHYGIPGVYGSRFRRVELGPEHDLRRGLLGKGAVLTVTAISDRTSTVRRGKWVDMNLLGVIPPDPPPGIAGLDEMSAAAEGGASAAPQTLRQRMQRHSADPACASCHQMFDPIGFALEGFDAIGGVRTTELGQPLDLSGRLVDGTEFTGPSELREALMSYSPRFVQTFTERLLTYALGRGVDHHDMPVVRSIVAGAADEDYRFSALVLGVVQSPPFRMNQLMETPPGATDG